jgi:hypothetical protein
MISNKKIFEEKIKPILTYVGTIGAILTSIAYIVTIVVLIVGFKAQKNLHESIIFSIVSALIGIVIIQFMKIQGIEFAKQLPENQEILKLYNNTQTVDKKPHSIKYYWITSVIKDIVIKGTSMCLTTAAIIYIVIEGSQDWNMFLLAIVNLVMFICFGMLTLTSSYDFYNDRHIPYINSLIKKGGIETNVQC